MKLSVKSVVIVVFAILGVAGLTLLLPKPVASSRAPAIDRIEQARVSSATRVTTDLIEGAKSSTDSADADRQVENIVEPKTSLISRPSASAVQAKSAYVDVAETHLGEAIRLLATITPRNKGAIEFGSDIQWICTYGRPNGTPIPQWIAEVIQVKRLPDNLETRISVVFLTQVAEAQCDGWGQSKEVPAGGRLSGREVSALMAGETLSLLLNDQTLAPQRGQLLAKYLLETKAPEQLRLMGRMVRRIEGGIMIPKLDPNPVAHAYDREMQAVRMAETWEVAMERLACRESNACGPNQLDSVIFCARHNICRDGFSVNDGLRELFSQRVLGDADLIVAEVLRQRSELGLD